MNELQPKLVADSYTEQVHIVMSEQINGANRLFGGRLLEWIDIVAGVVGRRHSRHNVTTVAMDKIHFKAPAYVNDIVVLQGKITYTGHTSMEVRVDTFVEGEDGMKRPINHAYIVMVALDKNECPTPVPPLKLVSQQERDEWDAAIRRNQLRKERRTEFY
ncbi:MAG: acyl-CoA thioesterase [Massiliimalia sp.]|jgi:acyl-CoA hydrolase